jgi:hypothetical protein
MCRQTKSFWIHAFRDRNKSCIAPLKANAIADQRHQHSFVGFGSVNLAGDCGPIHFGNRKRPNSRPFLYSRLTVAHLMAIARAGIICLCAASWLTPAWGADALSSELRQLDEQVQSIKLQTMQLERDLKQLENTNLYPPEQQVRIFVAMEVFDFELNAVQVTVNGRELATHEYTPRELYALRKGGVQELYLGNISPGVHALQARFIGQFSDKPSVPPYEKSIEVSFRKTAEPKWLELRIDSSTGQNLSVRVFQREPEE